MKEEPIEILSFSRVKHKIWNKEKKADVVICGNINYGWSDKINCEECGRVCYYSSKESLDLKTKFVKKICLNCGLTKYKGDLNEEQINLLKMAGG